MHFVALLAASLAASPQAAPAPASTPDPSARVCRTSQVIGSRLSRQRTCKTQAEWAEVDRAARDGLRDAQTRQLAPTLDGVLTMPNGSGPPR